MTSPGNPHPRRSGTAHDLDLSAKAFVGIRKEMQSDDQPEPSRLETWSLHFIQLCIFSNTLVAGLSIEIDPDNKVWHYIELFFTAVFAMEMLVKLYVLRLGYFESNWNRFDFVICFVSLLEVSVLSQMDADALESMSTMRIFRLIRLLRMFRSVKVNRHLIVLSEALAASLRSMLWVGALLMLVVYSVAVVCRSSVDIEAYKETELQAENWFDTLGSAMITLFALILCDGFTDVMRPLAAKQLHVFVFLVMFMFVASFGMLNLVIGIIAESTTRATQEHEREQQYKGKRQKMIEIMELADDLFASCPHEVMHEDEFLKWAKDRPEMREQLEKDVQLPRGFDLHDIFLMFNQQSFDGPSKDEFVNPTRRQFTNL